MSAGAHLKRRGTPAVALILFACASRPLAPSAPVKSPRPAATAAREPPRVDPLDTPPPAGPPPVATFPEIEHASLLDGMPIRVVVRKDLPIVEIRLVVMAGTATDGDRPGKSAITSELLKEGGAGALSREKLVERAESLGAELEIETGRDSTSIGIAVTKSDFERALELVATVALRPRFAPAEFEKLRERAIQRVRSAEAGDADWAASMVLYRQLFASTTAEHPYAHYAATAAELARLTLSQCKEWYVRHFAPQNALLVVTGDVEPAVVERAASRSFSRWRGSPPPAVAFPPPALPLESTVWLVDRPRSGQAEVYLATLGPERSSPSWPALAATSDILGGGPASRLFLDVREKRSLAYHAGAVAEEPAHGPVPLVLSAGTQTAKAPATLEAMLENLQRIAAAPPAEWEVGMAARSLSDALLFQNERLGALADVAARLSLLGLPDHYFRTFQRDLERLAPASVFDVARRYYGVEHPVIVVAGDAAVIGEQLRPFGNVEVVDPERDFATVRELPRAER